MSVQTSVSLGLLSVFQQRENGAVEDTLAGTAAQGRMEVRWGEHCRVVSVWPAGQEQEP